MKIKIYVEGGGDTKALRSKCREGFRKLLEKASFKGRMPAIVACGARRDAYDDFRTAAANATPGQYPILLVDSEGPVSQPPWQHLKAQDGWEQVDGTDPQQAQLMVQCMETWIVADREALRRHFGQCFRESSLRDNPDPQTIAKDDVQSDLASATRDCARNRQYAKGRRSFELLGRLDPDRLKAVLPSFQSFGGVLARKS